jgi:hypothetical protein
MSEEKHEIETAPGEHFHRGVSTDFEEWLIYAAVAAHDGDPDAVRKTIPILLEKGNGTRIAMQINGVEVSPRLFIARLEQEWNRLCETRREALRKEAATLIKGRVAKLHNMLSALEASVQQELCDDFPELSEAIFE